jgi:ATP-binding cassette subfamily F protein 3
MIRLNNITKNFGMRTLFSDVSYHFPANERIALVGANGTGKSTLLKIIAKEDASFSGEVLIPPKVRLSYLPQEPNPNPLPSVLEECVGGAHEVQELKDQMNEALEALAVDPTEKNAERYADLEAKFRMLDGYSIEAKAEEILVGLGFSKEYIARNPLQLSGGWRMRVELAKLFINQPDFLILDEPTNHLDLPSLVWVESYLQKFRGTLLFVSHDRELLNRLATMTLHLYQNKITAYHGNFDQFLVQKELRDEQDQNRLAALARRRESMEDFVERFGAKASKASQAQSRVKMIERIKELEGEVTVGTETKVMSLRLPTPSSSGREVYDISGGAVGYAHPLSKNIKLKVERHMKIAIIGANGIGKSTLLKTIAGVIPALSGTFKIGYNVNMGFYAQDQLDTLRPSETVLANLLMSSAEVGESNARNLLGNFLFHGDDVFKKVSVLSGGEKSRVGLACVLAQKANFLLLDEPTNHLDMGSVEVLIDALGAYEGTAMFVSHDRNFIDHVCTHVFVMLADGRSEVFEGKLSDYVRMAEVAGFPNIFAPAVSEKSNAGEQKKVAQQERSAAKPKSNKHQERALQKRLAETESRMARLKTQIEALEKQLAETAPTAFHELNECNTALESAHAELRAAEEEWISISEMME